MLRRCQPLQLPISPPLSRAKFAEHYGADLADVERLRMFGQQHGVQEISCDLARRTLRWYGSAESLQKIFSVRLGHYQISPDGSLFVGCSVAPTLPDPAVIAVLGLDRRPVAHPHFQIARTQPNTTYTPLQIGQLYAFPEGNGEGQTIAIIELGGGYRQADLDTYFQGLGITTPVINVVSVDRGSNNLGSSADGEVMLDIEIAGALAPAAEFVMYFASNTDQGFYEAISQAAHNDSLPATVMSISWGGGQKIAGIQHQGTRWRWR